MPSIKAECRDCSGTGLYQGFAEPKDTAVICRGCGGSGCQTITYKEFTGRKRKRNVKYVLADHGLWFVRTSSEETITIQEFYSG